MDEMPSAQFRKTYASLRESVVVTVNGHAIGMWTPLLSDREVRDRLAPDVTALSKTELLKLLERPEPKGTVRVTARGAATFAQYRPVPKATKR